MATGAGTPSWVDRALVAAVATGVALRLAPATMADDAAISFRYAQRLADGDGLSYNDHEHVLGVSNALYTLLLAAFDAVGVSPPTAARAIGVATVVAVALLAQELVRRRAGRGPGLLAAAAVLVAAPFVGLATSGLEAGLAAALGLGAFLALERDRPGLAGLLAGLALVNKLDASLLVVALVVAERVGRGRWPWRLLGTAAVVVAPVALIGLVHYGVLLPRSLTAKLSGDATADGYDHDPTWAVRTLGPAIALFALAAVIGLRRPRARGSSDGSPALVLGLLAWSALQLLAASAIDLGGTYGWYLTVAIPPLAVGAVLAATASPVPTRRGLATGALALALVGGVISTVPELGGEVDASELVDQDRIAAGRWLDEHTEPGTVVDTCFGWVAYEAPDVTVADRCGLTSDRVPGPVRFRVETPVGDEPSCAPGDVEAAAFSTAARRDTDQPRIVVCRVMLSDL